jgi:hypothetical protein
MKEINRIIKIIGRWIILRWISERYDGGGQWTGLI